MIKFLLGTTTLKEIRFKGLIKMMKLRTRRLFKSGSSSSKIGDGGVGNGNCGYGGEEIEWEVRPGGMLVQRRESGKGGGDLIRVRVRVSMASLSHDISIAATSTFGELKMVLSLMTGLEPRAQRILFKGKEREDGDRLHMVGVKDTDKVLLLEDPALKEKKLSSMMERSQVMGSPCHTTAAIKV